MPPVLAVIQPVQPRRQASSETETCSNSPRRSDFGDDLGPSGAVFLVGQHTAGTQRLQLLEPLGDPYYRSSLEAMASQYFERGRYTDAVTLWGEKSVVCAIRVSMPAPQQSRGAQRMRDFNLMTSPSTTKVP